ncbi:hypothetical protein G9A89_003038 [Geosiphon pyriformis]|nr:hypothetical protein G9A89_003038 [Geosiphon pyriformis]
MAIFINQSTVTAKDTFLNSELPTQPCTISTNLPTNDVTANISTTHISTSSLLTTATNNILTTAATNNLSDTYTVRIMTAEFRNRNYLSLLVTPEDISPNTWEPKQKQSLTNILPATVIKNESLAAIFFFEIEKLTETPLFSGTILKEKPITAMYTDAKIDGQFIKLILDNRSAGSIITRQFMNQLANRTTKISIGEINNLLIEINGIIVPIKVLIIEATQYQALVSNNWLSKINTILDWNTQELQLSQNRQHTHVPAMCGHFKLITMLSAPLIEFKEEKEKPI